MSLIKKIKKIIKILFILLFIFICFKFYKDNYTFEITKYDVNIDNMADSKFEILRNKKIIHISDLHNQKFGEKNIELIKAIDNFKPDYIFLTGDMVNAEDTDFDGFKSLVDEIKKYKSFYVVGNHELGLKNNLLLDIYDYLINNGIYVLDNASVEIDGMNFYGLNYDVKYYKRNKYTVENMNDDLRSMW